MRAKEWQVSFLYGGFLSSMVTEDRVDEDLSSELDAGRPEVMSVSTMQNCIAEDALTDGATVNHQSTGQQIRDCKSTNNKRMWKR